MHIDSIYFPIRIWVNYYHNNKRTHKEMNVVNTRTNILYIHGCHTRTNHKKNVSCYSCKSHSGKHSLSSLKANIQMPKFLEKLHAWLHEDMQQVNLGGRGPYSLSSLHFSTTIIPFFRLIYQL